MAFCRNCGNQIPDNVKFCENCGTAVEINVRKKVVEAPTQSKDDYDYDYDNWNMPIKEMGEKMKQLEESALDKFGKFIGIVLLILALVDFFSDPPILTIFLAIIIISGCIFCFIKRYKLKGFTIAAIIIASICLLTGIGQGKKYGLFKSMPQDDYKREATEVEIKTTPVAVVKEEKEEVKAEHKEEVIKKEEITKEQIEESIEETADTDTENIDSTEKTSGVDSDLKAFLDSYESFMDEYVEFMKKYQSDSGNALGMMNDYLTILTKYEEFAQKADSYNQDEMSKEDLAYYLDSMNRIQKKMLEAL